MKPSRNRNETAPAEPVSAGCKLSAEERAALVARAEAETGRKLSAEARADLVFQAEARREADVYAALVDWRAVPGIALAAPGLARRARAVTGAHPFQWSDPSRRKLDSWGNLIDRGVVDESAIKAGGELLQIIEALSSGGGLGSRDPFAERVDRSYDTGLDGRERIVGLYQARYLPWLKSMAKRPARQGRPSAGFPDQPQGIVCVACTLLVLRFGASLRAIDAKARKRPGTALSHLLEGLQTYGHYAERRARARFDASAKLQRGRS